MPRVRTREITRHLDSGKLLDKDKDKNKDKDFGKGKQFCYFEIKKSEIKNL